MLLVEQATHLAKLLQFIVSNYFTPLSSILIVYNSTWDQLGELQQSYLVQTEAAFQQVSDSGNFSLLKWLDVANFTGSDFEDQMLLSVDTTVVEGYITILPNTTQFLHARHYATRIAHFRLKDKLHLYMCVNENPVDLLGKKILQLYPHHLMIKPKRSCYIPSVNSTTKISETARRLQEPERQQLKQANNYNRTSNQITTQKPQQKATTTTPPRTTRSTRTTMPVSKKMSALTTTSTRATASAKTTTPPRTTRSASTRTSAKTTTPASTTTSARATTSARRTTSARTATAAYTAQSTLCRDITFEMWTQKFVGASGNLDPVLLNSFLPNETFVSKIVELYPNKLMDMKGRALRLSTQTYPPYTVSDYVPPGKGDFDPVDENAPNRTVTFLGSEANIIITFCIMHNCHLRVEPYGPDSWGGIYEDGTSDGMMGALYKQRVEFTIGCVYDWYPHITETSVPLAHSAITILGPSPAQFAPWRTSILPFDSISWRMIVGTLLVCSVLLYVLKYSSFLLRSNKSKLHVRIFEHWSNLEKSLLDIFALFIQQSSTPTTFERFAPRIFLATLLCATITLENIYSGQLKSLLTVPLFTEPIDTIAKWATTDWKWGAPSHIWAATVMDSNIENERILYNLFEVRDYDYLRNGSFRPDYGLGLERLHSGTFTFGSYITPLALKHRIILKDDVYITWTYAVSIRGWPLMNHMNRHLRYCLEAGLYVRWELDAVADYLDRRTQEILLKLASGHSDKPSPKALSVANVSGPLFALCFGYIMAAIVFGFELLWQRLKNYSATVKSYLQY